MEIYIYGNIWKNMCILVPCKCSPSYQEIAKAVGAESFARFSMKLHCTAAGHRTFVIHFRIHAYLSYDFTVYECHYQKYLLDIYVRHNISLIFHKFMSLYFCMLSCNSI